MVGGWVVIRQTYMAELFLGKLLQSAKSEKQRNFVNLFSECFTRNSTLSFLWLTRNATFRKNEILLVFFIKNIFINTTSTFRKNEILIVYERRTYKTILLFWKKFRRNDRY